MQDPCQSDTEQKANHCPKSPQLSKTKKRSGVETLRDLRWAENRTEKLFSGSGSLILWKKSRKAPLGSATSALRGRIRVSEQSAKRAARGGAGRLPQRVCDRGLGGSGSGSPRAHESTKSESTKDEKHKLRTRSSSAVLFSSAKAFGGGGIKKHPLRRVSGSPRCCGHAQPLKHMASSQSHTGLVQRNMSNTQTVGFSRSNIGVL